MSAFSPPTQQPHAPPFALYQLPAEVPPPALQGFRVQVHPDRPPPPPPGPSSPTPSTPPPSRRNLPATRPAWPRTTAETPDQKLRFHARFLHRLQIQLVPIRQRSHRPLPLNHRGSLPADGRMSSGSSRVALCTLAGIISSGSPMPSVGVVPMTSTSSSSRSCPGKNHRISGPGHNAYDRPPAPADPRNGTPFRSFYRP